VTAAVLDRPHLAQPALDGGGTLEELLSSALRKARANGSAECPVCHGALFPTRAGAREAECGRCGSRLS
jgi:hypothetical protein